MNFPGTVLDKSVQDDSAKFVQQQNNLLNAGPQPITYGSYYRGPNDATVTQNNAQTVAPSSESTKQTTASQLSVSPKPFSDAGSKEYGSSSSSNLKTTNYKSFLDMLEGQKQKYIGVSLSSQPKQTSTYSIYAENKPQVASQTLKATTDIPQSVQATIDASKAGSLYGGSGMTANEASQVQGIGWKNALSTVQQAADSIGKAQQNLARTQYENDVAEWEQKGKYWFDVNSNLKPDLEKYMEGMPSSVDSLKEGSWVTSLQDGNTDTAGEYLSSVFINPAGGKSGNDVADAILNPLNILEQAGWVDEGMVNYVGGKAAEGAIGGGFVGAIIGVIDGIFSWNSAKKEDAKRKKAAQEEYERKLQEWTYNTNKRLADAHTKRNQEIEATSAAYRDKRKAEAKEDKRQKISDIASVRKEMATALLNAGSVKEQNRNSRLARWGK